MMKKIVAILFLPILVAGSGVARGQMVPDNDNIFAKTIGADSPFNYAALTLRYNAGDTTLTLEEYHYLYYGYAFTEAYKPLSPIPAEDKILMVFERSPEPGYEDMLDIIKYATEVMKADPFSPKNLNFLTYAYGSIGDTVNERINYDRMTKVVGVIEASGDGLKEETPMHVLRFSHAADVLIARDLTIVNRMVVSRTTEYIGLQEKDGKNKGYYFDFSRVYWNKPDETPKQKHKWEFNGIPLKR